MAKKLSEGRKPQTFKTPRFKQPLIKDVRPIVECLGCGNLFASHYIWAPRRLKMYCSPQCSGRRARGVGGRHRLVEQASRTISNTPRANIAVSAQGVACFKPRRCFSCGYDGKSLDVAHLIPVKSFPDDTPISIVNSESNLRVLCKNCHWEYDHNKETGMELAAQA